MKDLKGTKTEKNLLEAFAGESQAYTKYTFYAARAKKEGYEQIAAIFAETATNEKEHAKLWFKYLHDGDIPGTLANLRDAAAGEEYEYTDMYVRMAKDAKEEGFGEIARKMEMVGEVENGHNARYLALVSNIENDSVFKKEEEKVWVCRNCGYVHKGKSAPAVCPLCNHGQAYFELRSENY